MKYLIAILLLSSCASVGRYTAHPFTGGDTTTIKQHGYRRENSFNKGEHVSVLNDWIVEPGPGTKKYIIVENLKLK